MLPGLRSLLQHTDIYDEVSQVNYITIIKCVYTYSTFKVCRSHKRADNLLSDICDGELFKTHELFSRDATALELIMYFDEVEPCNALGAQAGIHKLGMQVCYRHLLSMSD